MLQFFFIVLTYKTIDFQSLQVCKYPVYGLWETFMLILFLNNNDNNNGNDHFESAKSLKVLSALKKKNMMEAGGVR